ncbi:MAG: Spi family protease inhibitor, partial [Bacteroidales bacterium]|nr:Spi family protease inhibitor [Bacteroidales bacterium]
MKKPIFKINLSLTILMISLFGFSNPVDIVTAEKIVFNKIKSTDKAQLFNIKEVLPISEKGIVYFYLAELSPKGYFIISADDELPPVIAYSFDNNADIQSPLTN